jgi:hypothetical protein
VGRVLGSLLKGRDDDPFDLLIGDLAGRARPWLIRQAFQPAGTNRDRHLVTVGRDTSSRRATSMLLAPSAQASTIRQRSASAWLEVSRRAQRSSVARSSSVNTSGGSFGPRRRGANA